MRKTISIVLILCALLFCSYSCTAKAESPFIETEGLSIDQFINPTTANTILKERQRLAHTMAECARQLGYEETHNIIQTAQEEWWNAEYEIKNNLLEVQYWMTKFEEYPYATYIWLFFTRQMGFSDEVVAGIMGNIMAEVGANTLNIQYWLYSYDGGYYYGICQWAKTYFPDVRGMDLIGQCEYLAKNIETQINAFGNMYNIENAYVKFLQVNSYSEAALQFAKLYEACDANTYYIRQCNAKIAYEYFTGDYH